MAANPERGEVDLVCGEQTYTLVLSVNALCIMEKRTGKPFGTILAGLMSLNVTDTRDYMRAVLAEYHGKEIGLEATKRKPHVDVDVIVGEIMQAAGMKRTKDALVEIFKLNTPDDKEAPKEGDGTGNPPGAQDGTGDSST